MPRDRGGGAVAARRLPASDSEDDACGIRAGGRSFGVRTHPSFDPGLIDWLAECDAFVHETNYGLHTPLERLTGLSAHARAKMRLIPYPDDLDPPRSNIALLRQGEL